MGVAELCEGEKRLVLVRRGNNLTVKVYKEVDYSFHAVFTTDDFASLAEAENYIDRLLKGLANG